MPNPFDATYRASDLLAEQRSAANTAITATAAAPGVNQRYVVHSITISADDAPVTGLYAEFRVNNVSQFEIVLPAGAFSPIHINYHKGLEIPVNQSVGVHIPALGGTVISSVQLHGKKVGR